MDRTLFFILISFYACSGFACLIPGCSHASHDDYEHYVIVHHISKPELDRLFLDNNIHIDSDQDRRVRNRLCAQQVRQRKAAEKQRQEELQQQLQSENLLLRRQNLAQQTAIQHLMLGQERLCRQIQILQAAAVAPAPPQDAPELRELAERLTQRIEQLEEENRRVQRENADLLSSFFPPPTPPATFQDPFTYDCDLDFTQGGCLSQF